MELQGDEFDILHHNGAYFHAPGVLSKMIKDDEILVTGIGVREDSWFLRCSKLVEDRPRSFTDWKVEHGMLYRNQTSPVTDGLMPDFEARKLVLSK